MSANGVRWFTAVFVVLVVAVLGLSMVGASNVAARSISGAPSAPASPASTASIQSSIAAGSNIATAAGVYASPAAGGPHPGTLESYLAAPGGTTTLDPAVAYYTVPYETILNVYQSLITFNGTQTGPAPPNWTPELAACTPGSAQCTSLFGSTLVTNNGTTGAPQYYTFVVDGSAQFYDPSTSAHWGVYPSDVMFSLSRTMAFGNLPFLEWFNGWIQEQWALPPGNPSWDVIGGAPIHMPFNNTPQHVLSSMLVNDSSYCPASAMTGSYHGCITFNVGNSGHNWPYFLELIGDGLGGSVTPCGWFTSVGAGLPGFLGSAAANGDGPCLLPGNATSTSDAGFQTFLTTTAPTAWDSVELLGAPAPTSPQPAVQFAMVGSGPYALVPGSATNSGGPGGAGGYTLEVNPAYVQPAACTGITGGRDGCEPPAGSYIPNVVQYYENADTAGIQAMIAGTADTASFDASHTSTLLQLVKEGKYGLLQNISGGTANWFMAFEQNFSVSGEKSVDPTNKLNIPGDFLANAGLRNFLVTSYPYTTIQQHVWTVDGISGTVEYGGAIPPGQPSYYPSNVSWPYLQGDPNTNVSAVNGAAWWWAQITNSASPLYDAQLAACTPSSPCMWPVVGWIGSPSLDSAISDWNTEVASISGGALQPYSYDLTGAGGFYNQVFKGNGLGTLPVYNWGWIADYADPTDFFLPMWQPNGTFTFAMAVGQVMYEPAYNAPSCGHSGVDFANLSYWANYPQNAIPTQCEGVAYQVMNGEINIGGFTADLTLRALIFNLVSHIGNELALMQYTYVNNANQDYGVWLSPTGINTNPSVGAAATQTWYTWTYASNAFTATFTETGLPSGTSWSVTLHGVTKSSTTGSIAFTGQTNGSYPYTVTFVPGYAASPSNGTLVINGVSPSVAVTFTAIGTPTYPLTVNEQGLLAGTSWSLTVVNVGTQTSTNTSIVFDLAALSYTYFPSAVLGYSNSGAGSTTVASPGTVVTVTYVPTTATTYTVTFEQTGLPASTPWGITLNGVTYGSTTSSTTFTVLNGTYGFSVASPTGFTPPAPTGFVDVKGANVVVDLPFSAAGTFYAVTFTETGLPTGSSWSAAVQGFGQTSTTASVAFNLPNGVYNWTTTTIAGYTTATWSGSVTVNGTAATVTIKFVQFTYAVTFFEDGLPAGTPWSVTVGGTTINSTSYNLVAYLPNGTAAFTVGIPAGYVATPASGVVTVLATATTQVIIFGLSYSVTFTESGLPSGGSWTVYMNGQSKVSSGSSVVFEVPNGTYTFTALVTTPSGYVATTTETGSTITVNGAAVSVTVTISAVAPTTVTKQDQNFLGTLAYSLIGVMAALAVIFLILALYFARRKPPMPPAQSWSPGQSTTTEGKSGDTGSPPSS